ncbi:uncharacterized protein LOC126299633 [Schistocerca gregaria]|uniref:uncharacterized protein LOC126299633 n=1 Tax=Schistocerca gregaria TaxID=7010 RepID=UPI00211F04FC|nr:uncharacterized protein LOC126299633 [Schistocerca gregaria]
MGHSSRQRSSAKSLKDDDSYHFLWDNQFDNKHHNASPNKTEQHSAEAHTEQNMGKNNQNSSSKMQKLNDIEEQTSQGPREDPEMEGVHSGKAIVGIVDEVMKQVEKSKEVSKHLGPFLKRDKAAEAEVHRPPAATACAGHQCPNQLLAKLTEAVAEIVNNERRGRARRARNWRTSGIARSGC